MCDTEFSVHSGAGRASTELENSTVREAILVFERSHPGRTELIEKLGMGADFKAPEKLLSFP